MISNCLLHAGINIYKYSIINAKFVGGGGGGGGRVFVLHVHTGRQILSMFPYLPMGKNTLSAMIVRTINA